MYLKVIMLDGDSDPYRTVANATACTLTVTILCYWGKLRRTILTTGHTEFHGAIPQRRTLLVFLCVTQRPVVKILTAYTDSRLRRWNLRRRFLIILSLCLQVRALPHERHFGHVSNLRPFGILHENPGIF